MSLNRRGGVHWVDAQDTRGCSVNGGFLVPKCFTVDLLRPNSVFYNKAFFLHGAQPGVVLGLRTPAYDLPEPDPENFWSSKS